MRLTLGVKKYLWFRFPTDPIFFCRPYYFFNAIDRATLFSPGGCGLLPKWRLLSQKLFPTYEAQQGGDPCHVSVIF
jgi:hypothetical protein